MTDFLLVHTFQTRRLYIAELGQLTTTKCLRGIMNTAKTRQYSCDVRGWRSDKKEGIFLSVEPSNEKTNRTLHLDPQRAGLWSIPMEFL